MSGQGMACGGSCEGMLWLGLEAAGSPQSCSLFYNNPDCSGVAEKSVLSYSYKEQEQDENKLRRVYQTQNISQHDNLYALM